MKKSQRLSIVLLLALIVSPILSQGGGGGGGGGGSSGGGDSGSSSSDFSSSSSDNCIPNCNGDQACINDCKRKSTIVGAVIGSVVGTIFAIVGIVFCCKKKPCNLCSQFTFNQMKRQYNKISPGSMASQQFRQKRNTIIRMINYSNENIKNYYFLQNYKNYPMKVTATITNENQNYQTQIFLSGNDNFGDWTAKGFIVCVNNGEILFWFYKNYDDKIKARQTGQWQHLFHISQKINFIQQKMEGKWFFKGFQHSNSYSGKWILQNINEYNFNQHIGNQLNYQRYKPQLQIKQNQSVWQNDTIV